MLQITSPPLPSESSGWTIGDANRWIGNILKDNNMSTSTYLLKDTKGNVLSLQDLNSGRYKSVVISANSAHMVVSNPSPSYAFTKKSSSRSRQTDNILQGSGLTPAYVRAVVDKEGLHKGTITLTKMLHTPDRRGRPSSQAIDILSSRLYKLPRTNPPSINHYILGSSYEGVSNAVREVVKDFLEFDRGGGGISSIKHKIPSYMSSDFALYKQFTEYALAPYVINSMANRKFIHRMSSVILPKVNMLIDMDEDMKDKKKHELKKKFEGQYEALISNLATSPADFYDGKDFAILVDPRFVFPEIARLMLPPPSELKALGSDDWSVAECMLFQADERNFSRDRIDLPSDMPDVTALFTGRHYEGRKPDNERHSLKEFYNTSMIDLGTLYGFATSVYDAEQSPFVNRSVENLMNYNEVFLEHARWRGGETPIGDDAMEKKLQGIADRTDKKYNSKSGILNIVDLEGIRPRPIGWPMPVVYGLMNTLAEYYDSTGMWPTVIQYEPKAPDYTAEVIIPSTVDDSASLKLDISTIAGSSRKRGEVMVTEKAMGPIVEEGVPLETLLIKTAHYAESKGHKVSGDDIRFAAFMLLYGLRHLSRLGAVASPYSPISTPIELITDEIAKGFAQLSPVLDADALRIALGIRTNPGESIVVKEDGIEKDVVLEEFIIQLVGELKNTVKKKAEEGAWYKQSTALPSLVEVGSKLKQVPSIIGSDIATVAGAIGTGAGVVGRGLSTVGSTIGTGVGAGFSSSRDFGSRKLQDVIKTLEATLSVEEMEDFHAMDKIAFRLSQKENQMLKTTMAGFPNSLVSTRTVKGNEVGDRNDLTLNVAKYIEALKDMIDVTGTEISRQLKETLKFWEGFLEQLTDAREPKRWLAFFDAYNRAKDNFSWQEAADRASSTPDIFIADNEIMQEFVHKISELALDMGLSSTYGIERDAELPFDGGHSKYAEKLVRILIELKDGGITHIKREHLDRTLKSGKRGDMGYRPSSPRSLQKRELRPTSHMTPRERRRLSGPAFIQQPLIAAETERRIAEKKQIEADAAMKKAEKRMGIGPSRKQRLLGGLGTIKAGISKRVGYGG